MARDKVVDAASANQLNISITTITPAQAWKRQVRGAYSLLYLHMQNDFLHIDDMADWLSTQYQNHTHGNGNNGSPTTQPLQSTRISDARAKSLLIAAAALGKIRRGVTGASSSISQIDDVNNRELA